jgi:hypothetical protein
VTALAPKAFYFRDCHALHANIGERRPNIVHLEGFDDRSDKLHGFSLVRLQPYIMSALAYLAMLLEEDLHKKGAQRPQDHSERN